MKTWLKKGRIEVIAIVTALVMVLPGVTEAGSGASANPGAPSGVDSRSPRAGTAVAGSSSAVAIVFPRDGGEVSTNGGRLYKVMGMGAPGGSVTVKQSGGQGGPVTVTVDPSGNWMTDAVFKAPPPINDAQHCTRNHSSCKSDPGTVTATEYQGTARRGSQRITIYGVITFN